jgi:hypothetical protein
VPAGAGTTFTLTVTKSGNGRGSVASDVQPGIGCGPTCSFDFPAGTPVELAATPLAGSTFTGWDGDCSGTGTCGRVMDGPHTVEARFARTYLPDGWIKLCGLSDGCTIRGLPNPWKGKDVYNSTGRKQTIRVRMEDGEGVRFWFTFENDGILADTFTLEGCKGTPKFRVNKVQIGFYKRPTAGSIKITEEFKKGTATFDLGPSADGDKIEITLNIIAPTTAEGVSYKCPVTIRSQGDPTVQDTMMTKMTTY